MKKISSVVLVLMIILSIAFSFLPMSTAQAKSESDLSLKVRNRTGAVVSLKLIDENGNPWFFSYQPGQSNTLLPDGFYTYYASTVCGNKSGVFNINVTKELIFSCGNSVEVSLKVPTRGNIQYCYSVWDWPDTPEEWFDYGPHCQDAPAQVGDSIPNEYSPGWWDTVEFSNSGSDICSAPEHGPAYYYNDCSNGLPQPQ